MKNSFPWVTNVSGVSLGDGDFTDSPSGYLSMIISAGELKPEFIQLAGGNLNSIFITSTANAGFRQNVSVCFMPGSKSFANEANAKYGVDGNVSSPCLATDAAGGKCYWCIK